MSLISLGSQFLSRVRATLPATPINPNPAQNLTVQDEILTACSGNLTKLQSLLDNPREDSEVDTQPLPTTQLMFDTAISSRQPVIVRYLLQLNPTAADSLITYNSVHAASNDFETYKILYEHNRAILKWEFGHTGDALSIAAWRGDLPFVSFMLSEGANPNEGHLFYRATIATVAGQSTEEVVKLLLKYDAKIDGTDALMYAVSYRKIANLRLLLEHGADVNEIQDREGKWTTERGVTEGPALHVAVTLGVKEAVQVLLEFGADPMVKDMAGRTAVMRAEEKRDKAITKLIKAAATR